KTATVSFHRTNDSSFLYFYINKIFTFCYSCYTIYITSKQKGGVMMFIQLDFESDLPIYEQLKNEIIIGIAKKQLLPGERLPSVRSLASDIGINLHTVNKAYQQLKHEGYLLINRQRGVVIHPDGPPKADETYKKTLQKILRPMVADVLCRDINKEQYIEMIETIYNEMTQGGESNE